MRGEPFGDKAEPKALMTQIEFVTSKLKEKLPNGKPVAATNIGTTLMTVDLYDPDNALPARERYAHISLGSGYIIQ